MIINFLASDREFIKQWRGFLFKHNSFVAMLNNSFE
jgi:hypothetical protein